MTIAVAIWDGVEELDVVGPYEVLASWGAQSNGSAVHVYTVAERADEVRCAHGLRLLPDRTWSDVGEIDVLVLPGGNARPQAEDERVLDRVRGLGENGTLMTSVCTGALILAAAGLLEGRPATTHWGALEALAQDGAASGFLVIAAAVLVWRARRRRAARRARAQGLRRGRPVLADDDAGAAGQLGVGRVQGAVARDPRRHEERQDDEVGSPARAGDRGRVGPRLDLGARLRSRRCTASTRTPAKVAKRMRLARRGRLQHLDRRRLGLGRRRPGREGRARLAGDEPRRRAARASATGPPTWPSTARPPG